MLLCQESESNDILQPAQVAVTNDILALQMPCPATDCPLGNVMDMHVPEGGHCDDDYCTRPFLLAANVGCASTHTLTQRSRARSSPGAKSGCACASPVSAALMRS